MLYIVNTVSPGSWPSIKMSICQGLVLQKPQKLCKILVDYYKDTDVMCLQECSSAVIAVLQQQLGTAYHVIVPGDADGTRDQNSVLCLSKKKYAAGHTEITQNIIRTFPHDSLTSVAAGDLLAIICKTVTGQECVLASFHGDSNGLATPVVTQKTAEFIEVRRPRPPTSLLSSLPSPAPASSFWCTGSSCGGIGVLPSPCSQRVSFSSSPPHTHTHTYTHPARVW